MSPGLAFMSPRWISVLPLVSGLLPRAGSVRSAAASAGDEPGLSCHGSGGSRLGFGRLCKTPGMRSIPAR